MVLFFLSKSNPLRWVSIWFPFRAKGEKKILTMERFWEHSWERIDPERVAGYVRSIDIEPDALIAALHRHGVKTVCDAGCGCGAYALKLAANGFSVCGFDVSSHAVQIAQALHIL